MTKITKKMLAVIMSMLMVFSCIAISASAEGEDTTGSAGTTTETPGVEGNEGGEGESEQEEELVVEVPAPECVFDEENKTISVKPIEYVQVGEVQYKDVTIKLEPEASVKEDETEIFFFNLEYGTTYTVSVVVKIGEKEYVSAEEDNFTVSVKNKQDAPATPVPTAVTSSSITVVAASGCSYAIKDSEGNVSEWQTSEGKETIEFKGLTANSYYTVIAQRPANDAYYASEEASITVKTKLTGKEGTPTIYLADKTNTSITVAVIESDAVEYSIDGKTWQSSGEFKGLTANTQYVFYARFVFDAALEDPSAISEGFAIKTNAVANFEASKKNISFSYDTTYADAETTFTVNGDGPKNMNNVVYGDTRIIPISYKVVYGENTIKDTTAWTTAKASNSGSFTAADYAEKEVTVKVTFEVQECKGKNSDGSANWVKTEEFTEDFGVKLGRLDSTGTRILEFFEKLANILFNTIPQFFASLMGSDVWGKLFEAIGNFGSSTASL